MPRFVLIPLAIVLILIVATAVLVPLLLDDKKVLELASDALYKETGATLAVGGETSVSVFPSINVSLADADITMPGKEQPDITARSLNIGVQLVPLLSGSVIIDTVHLDGISARLESAQQQGSADSARLSDEELDAFYAARREAMSKAGDAAGAEAVLVVPMALNVQHLKITDSKVEVLDAAGGPSTVIELVKLETTGLNLDGTDVPIDLELRLPGEQTIGVNAKGVISIDQATQAVTLDAIKVVITGATAQPVSLQTEGDIDLSRQVADLQIKLELGETRGGGSLRYASFESPQIDTRLQLNLFDPALLALAGPEAAAAGDSEGTGSSGDEPLPLEAIRLIDSRADLAIDQAIFGAHTIHGMQVKLRAVDGVIRINSLTGKLHGGMLDLAGTFNGKHNTASLGTKGGLKGMDIAAALAAMESEPTVQGSASLNWQLHSKGQSVNELIAALKGPVKLQTEEVVLQDVSVEHMLCQAVALTNKEALTAKFPDSTRFETLAADIRMGQGKAILRPLRAELPQVALNGTGAFDLLTQDFEASFKASLSPELEQLDHACRVSKRLTAIDWPVDCAGNAGADPAEWCKVDTEEIIEDLAKYEGKRKLEKEAGKLLDKLFK